MWKSVTCINSLAEVLIEKNLKHTVFEFLLIFYVLFLDQTDHHIAVHFVSWKMCYVSPFVYLWLHWRAPQAGAAPISQLGKIICCVTYRKAIESYFQASVIQNVPSHRMASSCSIIWLIIRLFAMLSGKLVTHVIQSNLVSWRSPIWNNSALNQVVQRKNVLVVDQNLFWTWQPFQADTSAGHKASIRQQTKENG